MKQVRNSLLKSFAYAISGIASAVKSERNMKFHLSSAFVVIFISWFLSIDATEWLIVLLLIGGMLSLELVNTAIERVVDLVTVEYHPLAKQAKDIAAAAVFVYAIVSVVAGIIIFLPKLLVFI